MKRIALLLACIAATASAAEPAATPAIPGPQAASSEAFVRKATQDGMLEVEAGKLALTKSTSADVKTFAQQMIADHGKANAELQNIVHTRYPIPTQLDSEHQAKLEALMTKSGADFDRTYSANMVKDHEWAVKMFIDAADDKTLNPELRQFAAKILPTLQEHHQMSLQLAGEIAK